MKKILIEGITSNIGGIEVFVRYLIENAKNKDYQFYLMLNKNSKFPYQEELENIGCKFIYITPRRQNYFNHISDLTKVYTQYNFDIIHINIMNFSNYERILLANKLSNAKIIVHSHNGNSCEHLTTKLMHIIGKIKTRNCDYIRFACGEKAASFMFGKNKNVHIIYNGIDFDKYYFSNRYRKEIREELKIQNSTFVIGQIAKLETQKNPLFLIDIFKEYHKIHKNSKLIIVGEGSLYNKVVEKINKNNLNDSVILLGKRFDAYKIYSAFDIFIMPSLYEGLSISLCEAQINGLKCYTSSKVAKESNIAGNVSFLPLAKSAKKWVKYINDCNNTRDNNIIKKLPQKFNEKKSYKNVYKIYDEICK